LRSSGDRGRRRPLGLGLPSERRERVRFSKSGAPYLFPIAIAVVAVIAGWLSWDRISAIGAVSFASPDTQIREALVNQRRGLLNDVYGFKAGGTAELYPVRFADVAIEVEDDRARVVAMLDGEGRVKWRDQQAHLRYLGRERFHMKPCKIALWCGEGDQFDRLRGVLQALFRRHDAASAGDSAALARLVSDRYSDAGEGQGDVLARLAREVRPDSAERTRIVAWQIRVERDRAEVGEEYERDVGGRTESARARYTLAWDGDRWVFVAGL
jgi:hypothetical protein